jgi:hypothetical protein
VLSPRLKIIHHKNAYRRFRNIGLGHIQETAGLTV